MTFNELILHPKTRQALDGFLRQPTHALLLTGDRGVGLGTIAETLARQIASASTVIVKPRLHDKQKTLSINIDDIRELGQFTRDRRRDALVIVIDEAEAMTEKAPEAFLKSLEEPVAQIFYILTTHTPAKLPATIKSRAQTVEILPPPTEMCDQLLAGVASSELAKIKFLGDRRPTEIVRLLGDADYFRATAAAMETAKNFVQGNSAQRLEIVAGTTTRDAAIALAQNVAKLLALAMNRAKNPKTAANYLNAVSEVIDNLYQNGNVRAQLTYLALNV
jgi:DNA polymerase III delta prime subunit